MNTVILDMEYASCDIHTVTGEGEGLGLVYMSIPWVREQKHESCKVIWNVPESERCPKKVSFLE